jgi:hypothetical protein
MPTFLDSRYFSSASDSTATLPEASGPLVGVKVSVAAMLAQADLLDAS